MVRKLLRGGNGSFQPLSLVAKHLFKNAQIGHTNFC